MKVTDANTKLSLDKNGNGSNRYCLHKTLEDKLHVMLIHAVAGSEYLKHKHSDTNEFYVIIDGEMVVHCWDEFGRCASIKMSTNIPSGIRTFSVEKNRWHSTLTGPNGATFFEFRSGPFDKENTIFEK